MEMPGVRPAVIDETLASSLGQLQRFRHLFRNVYGFVLEDSRLRPLQEELTAIAEAFI